MLSIWFILALLSSDLSYFCNWWKSLPLLESKRGLMWVCNFTSFCGVDCNKSRSWPLCCFACRGFWRDYPNMNSILAEIGHSKLVEGCVLFVGHEPGKNSFPEMWPTTSTAENTKNTQSETFFFQLPPTFARFFLDLQSSGCILLWEMALILKLQAVRSLGQEVGFLFRWLFWGVLQGWQRNIANFSMSSK